MRHYHHISIEEREKLLVDLQLGKSIRQISKELGRSPSTISRELGRNRNKRGEYSSSAAQGKYERRRKVPGRKLLEKNPKLYHLVRSLFLERQWSPEQISNRLKYEEYPDSISYKTIYRSIYCGLFDEGKVSKRKSVVMKLRHRGKKRKSRNQPENRGAVANMSPSISQRPPEALDRGKQGHWEGDTVNGKINTGSILTLVERRSRYLLAEKLETGSAKETLAATSRLLSALDEHKRLTLTLDRGCEFRYVDKMKEGAGIDIYFAHPHSPWERPTNENTNGLLREYIPKGRAISEFSGNEVKLFTVLINYRPRKCLGWKTPAEVFHNKVLHFA